MEICQMKAWTQMLNYKGKHVGLKIDFNGFRKALKLELTQSEIQSEKCFSFNIQNII